MRLSLSALLDGWLAPSPDPRRIAWIGGSTFAHRGLHGPGIPENSLAAFGAAVERGLGIECDVQLSSDGQAMIFHDWELDRMTAETGLVARRTVAQLAAIRLTGGEEGIPTLRQVLDLLAGQVPILIEVKSRAGMQVGPVCATVRRVLEGYRGDHAVISFDPRVGRWFARHAPRTLRGLSFTEENDHPLVGSLRRHVWLWQAKPDFLVYDIRDLPSRFAAAQRRRGLPIVSWTIDSADLRQHSAAYADAPIAEGAGLA
jgi:glycerophosphoryl diester phosphodiesterase